MCTLILYLGFICPFFFLNTHLYCSVGCLSMGVWTHAVLGILYAYVSYFCICTCSAQLSMFHMEKHSRNMLTIIFIIIIIHPNFPWPIHNSDLNFGTLAAILPGAWCCRVSARTGWPGVSIPWLCEIARLMCNLYLSVAACTIVCTDLSLKYACMSLGHYSTDKQLTV